MDLKSLVSERMDEYELLMLIARHLQFDRSCFGDSVKVIHLDSDIQGMALISEVVAFEDTGTAGKYYHSNGRTTRPVILLRPDEHRVSLLLSGAKYYRHIKVLPNEIKMHYDAGHSILESRKRQLKHITEEELYEMVQGAIGEFKSALSKKSG